MFGIEISGLVFTILSVLFGAAALHQLFSHELNYLKDLSLKFERLKENVNKLLARESYICSKLEVGRVKYGKIPNPEVTLWQNEVQRVVEFVALDSIPQAISEASGKCFPNYFSKRSLGKLIEGKIQNVKEVLNKGQFSDDSITYLPLERGLKFDTSSLRVLKRNKKIGKEIFTHLNYEATQCIGVYGMGGVGKTTIMEGVNNQLIKLVSRFDYIIWVTVTKDCNLTKLQDNIARKVGLDLSNDTDEMSRKAILSQALERRGRFVLILDDIWEAYPLEDVGIPHPTRENGCKLLLTTRSLSVCHDMETQTVVHVKLLDEEEAWDLFQYVVGQEVLQSSQIQIVANDVVKECGRLPLAIMVVGKALKCRNDLDWWINARDELRLSTARINKMEEKVFACLRFSYERLRDDEARNCFLYAAVYPEDEFIKITELIEHWIWDGLLGDERRLEDKVRRGKIILHELIDACMLETVDQEGKMLEDEMLFVKMHDLMRDIAIQITREMPRFIIKAGLQLKECPLEWTKDVEKISLMRNRLTALPDQPRCPRLTSLLLQENLFKKIPGSFFDYMRNLRVLNLSYTRIKSLPHEMNVLKNLRYLDLRGTLVQEFPEELLPSLTSLEDLRLSHLPSSLLKDLGILLIGGKQLEMCTKLKILWFGFVDIAYFNAYVRSEHWKQLERFKFFVGFQMEEYPNKLSGNRCVVIKQSEGIDYLPANTDDLTTIGRFNGHKISMWLSGLEKLKMYSIHNCAGTDDVMKALTNDLHKIEILNLVSVHTPKQLWTRKFLSSCRTADRIRFGVPPRAKNLKVLSIEGIENRNTVQKPLLPSCTAANLKALSIENSCTVIVLLFPKLLLHLPSLEKLTVKSCYMLEEIIADEREEDDIIVLPSLKQFQLIDLPSLRQIYKGVLDCEFLQTIKVVDCPVMRRLPLYLGNNPTQLSAPKALKEIRGDKLWWDSLGWNPPDAKILLQPLFSEQ